MQVEVQLLSVLPPGHEGLGGATGLTGQRGWGVSSQGQVGGAGGDGWRLWGESSDQETGCGTQAVAGGSGGAVPREEVKEQGLLLSPSTHSQGSRDWEAGETPRVGLPMGSQSWGDGTFAHLRLASP